jgi:hypothetical protein
MKVELKGPMKAVQKVRLKWMGVNWERRTAVMMAG